LNIDEIQLLDVEKHIFCVRKRISSMIYIKFRLTVCCLSILTFY